MTVRQFIPSLDDVPNLLQSHRSSAKSSDTHKQLYVPVYSSLPADLLTPVSAYLKVAENATYSFLLESVEGGEKIGRYSFIGADPQKLLVTGEGEKYLVKGDPLIPVEEELSHIECVQVRGLPSFTGGAIGFVTFDCIKYFEPRTARPLKDVVGLPESMFLFCDTIIIFDHLHHVIKVVSHLKLSASDPSANLQSEYHRVTKVIEQVTSVLQTDHIPLPYQPPIPRKRAEAVSNVGKEGYESFVTRLKHHIHEGDIFQAVPSQRLARPTALHPFNAYRHLRSSNPSPYMFYLDMKDFQLVGASPEMLVKVDNRKVYTHPIAGTRKRGATPEEDDALATELLSDEKERAEHIMLVDLGRNDVNRICEPETVKVDSLMHIERYSHVMHIVSVVSGILRPEQTQFTAFRSIFPAGTVSGSPKIRAMELIADLEKEKRGVYAGAVGYFDYNGGLDTCIAIRTMVFKNGIAYLQAGGGIVYDSVEEDEYIETINKLKSNVTALQNAEEYFYNLQALQPDLLIQSTSTDVAKSTKLQPELIQPSKLAGALSANDIYKLPSSSSVQPTILIDNYDSFVFNVYQFLSSEGANVLVFRNDQITLAQIKALNPVNIVVSPGPGKPCDAGISPEVIKEFAGKIPIFGVCLGEQSMYEVFGGVVTYAGEIVHGKTSEINHDGQGVYKGIPQRFNVTRYHSLAGDPKTLPEDLEMTSWTDNGLIMGVRHKKFTIEGVQYHPESVMSEHGHTMMRNFLKFRGGLWSDNVDSLNAETKTSTVPNGRPDEIQVLALTDSNSRDHILKSNQQSTILQQIHAQRLIDIKTAKSTPGKSEADLEALISLGLSPSLISFADRLRESKHSPAVMAEIKRASPSKGLIDIKAIAPKQALLYAQAGASVISVLTEPKWFKGTLDDLRSVRQAIDSLPNRPAVLRKDFIVDSYQILESRLAGADTILLIVAMLADDQLLDLIKYSRMLGMEPLVEVNNTNEMTRALKAGAKVIGVNNRNLHTFDVDMNTTSRLAEMVPNDVIVAALSGIWGRKDVEQYVKQGVGAVLVGEALMRSSDKKLFIEGLWGLDSASFSSNDNQRATIPKKPLAKICGIKTVQAAITAAEAGADLIGMIFVPNMKRTVSIETARTIVSTIKSKFHRPGHNLALPSRSSDLDQWFSKSQEYLLNLLLYKKPLTVGVFMNQSATEILNVLKEVDLDVIQLHGEENPELARLLPKPVIKVFKSSVIESAKSSGNGVIKVQEGFYHFVLLDSGSGSGQVLDWKTLPTVQGDNQETVDIILAGGLNPQNVGTALKDTASGLLAVDVSSGVEEDGAKKDGLIREFVKIVKN